jgi:hypothetical protein
MMKTISAGNAKDGYGNHVRSERARNRTEREPMVNMKYES